MNEPLFDINDLAQQLKIPAKTIRNKLSNGTWPIPPVHIGRAIRWQPSVVASAIIDLAGNKSTVLGKRQRTKARRKQAPKQQAPKTTRSSKGRDVSRASTDQGK
jgi:hypothetical protein